MYGSLLNVFLGLLVAVALINWGTVFWFDFNIVEMITFGINWLMGLVYSVVAVVGTIWVLGLVGYWFSKAK